MDRRDTSIAILLSVALVVFLIPLARMGVDFHHDGIMLKPALDVLSGQVLFRDTFMQYGALTCYLQVLALWVHPSLLAVKFMTVAAYGMTIFFLYASWRLILPRSLTILSCGLFMLFIPGYEKDWVGHYLIFNPWSSVFAMMFQSMAIYSLFRIIRGEQSKQWALVLGVTCAAVFWCRQPVGIIMVGCVSATLIALHYTHWDSGAYAKRPIIVKALAGFVMVNGIMFGGILISGGRTGWWYQNYIWPKKWAADMYEGWSYFANMFLHVEAGLGLLVLILALTLPVLLKRIHPSISRRSIIVYFIFLGVALLWQRGLVLEVLSLRNGGWVSLLPFVVLLQSIYILRKAFSCRGSPQKNEYYLIATLSALSLGSLLQYYPVPDSWHVVWSLAPVFGLFIFVAWRCSGLAPSILLTALAIAFFPTLWMKAHLIVQAFEQPMETLSKPAILRGMKVQPHQAHMIDLITDTLEQISHYRTDMPSAMIGDDAMFLCLTANHANPSPYFVTWSKLADKDEEQKRWSYILRVRPIMFLHKVSRESVDDFYRRAYYVPILVMENENLELAVPKELDFNMTASTHHRQP